MSTDLNWLWAVLQNEGESGATNDLAVGIEELNGVAKCSIHQDIRGAELGAKAVP